ncbi:ABC transporter permease [Thermotoga sp. Ku-13t]|uniref:ABC transporter permease n=1 Tax=Thermotoga sp. Ku-13t TaxID=1755813 RepID=UPI0013EDA637|nr:ABC transporter permease [Thermotoga sp. Ku-13t]KAF2958027.1 ABC transporter permease [Thermotoga sp. Ku-13t]
MLKFLGKRVLQIVILLFIYVTVVYWLIEAMPGSFVDQYLLNPKLTPEIRENLKRQFGFDKPAYMRYLIYMKNFLKLDLGISFSYFPTKVTTIIAERLPRTVFLFVTSTLVSYALGYSLGKRAAWKRSGMLDKATTFVGIVFWTIFLPLLAIFNIWLFGVILKILPLNQFIDPNLWKNAPLSAQTIFIRLLSNALVFLIVFLITLLVSNRLKTIPAKKLTLYVSPIATIVVSVSIWILSGYSIYAWDIIKHMVLPVLTLTLYSFAGSMLVMRDTMLDVIKEDYVTTAKAKGLPDSVVRDKHAARNALLPLVTNFVIGLGATVGGGIITETMFSWPGMGRAYLEALNSQDTPLLIGLLVFTGIFVLIAHLVADILYAVLDPRIRY